MINQRLNIVIAGANGRMGRCLLESVLESDSTRLHAALVRPGYPLLGQDAGSLIGRTTHILLDDNLDRALDGADVLIDFTHPSHTQHHLSACEQYNVAIVIGTTGLDEVSKAAIQRSASSIPIVFSPNFSIGVNLTFTLLDIAARVLKEGYDIEIIETHHRFKIDAPSGTARKMGEIVANALGRDLNECAVYGREGITGEREANTIGFATIRGGDVVGDHTVLFAALGERIEITHKAGSRSTFANGAIRAACWLANKPHGLYTMQDVLGL